MKLNKLQEIKDSIDKGVIVSKPSWLEVLDWAIELTKHHETGKGPKNACDDPQGRRRTRIGSAARAKINNTTGEKQ